MNKDIRWHQRFENFHKAFLQLTEANEIFDRLSRLEKEGLVQRFEYTFELAWKTLKDFLEAQDVEAKFPRDVIKSAFQYELVLDGEIWMDMLDKRNILAHTYDESRFEFAVNKINGEYYGALKQVHDILRAML